MKRNSTLRAEWAKKRIGKQVVWEEAHDYHRGTCLIRRGVIEEVKGRNVRISGDWKWLPDLTNLKEKPATPSSELS